MRQGHHAIILAAMIFGPTPAFCHHSPAAYDLRPGAGLELTGTVTRVQWANPHVYVYLETQSQDSENAVWRIEVDAPSNMERHGWHRDSLVAGERVTAQVFPSRNAARKSAKLFGVLKADGTRLSYIDPALSDAAPGERAENLAGTWAPDPLRPDSTVARLQEQLIRMSFGLDADVPLTEKGMEAVRSFTDEASPTVDCIPRTAPSITMYSSGLHSIEVRDDGVMLRENWFGTERTVHLDVASHDGAPYTLHGHSIGRREGDVLVVDTARFSEHREGLFNKLPSSREKRLVERFELNPDGRSLKYSWELTDPEYLTEPVSGENHWAYRPDLEFSIVECSLDSARQFLDED